MAAAVTQKEMAAALVLEIEAKFRGISSEVEVLVEDLESVLAEAQNSPPDGGADGSIDEATWKAYSNLARDVSRFMGKFGG